jgi:hypothetical protein
LVNKNKGGTTDGNLDASFWIDDYFYVPLF